VLGFNYDTGERYLSVEGFCPPEPGELTRRPARRRRRRRIKIGARIAFCLINTSRPAMIRISELKLPLATLPTDGTASLDALRAQAAQILGIAPAEIASLHVYKRSFDAQGRAAGGLHRRPDAAEAGAEAGLLAAMPAPPHPAHARHGLAPAGHAPAGFPSTRNERPVVVGFGPCGIFAALVLAQMGFRPIVLERGKTVRERTKDTWGLWRKKVLNPESNVQFGEGGAGTFSDGKLYSQIKDPRHLGRKVMEEFVQAGAPEEILYVAPHIGTFKLVKVVETLREQIIALGGEVRFQQRVVDVRWRTAGRRAPLRALQVLDVASGQRTSCPPATPCWPWATARATPLPCCTARRAHEAKPFSVGFRIEHPQSLIDRARWGRHAGHPCWARPTTSWCTTPAMAARSTASACARAARWWPPPRARARGHQRHEPVLAQRAQRQRRHRGGHRPGDYPRAGGLRMGLGRRSAALEPPAEGTVHPLAGVVLQRQLESRAFELGGGSYEAPGQLLGDLLAGRPSTALGSVQPSYKPGVSSATCRRPCPVRDQRDARGLPGLRPQDQGLRPARCGAHRSRRAPRRRSRWAAAKTCRA
jgi:uncharacterized FAD-dependent dehydrogenase